MPNFTANDWCWQLADGRVWGTKAAAFVEEDAQAAWLVEHGLEAIPPSPNDETGEASEVGLRAALVFYGLPLGELMTPVEQLAAMQKQFTDAIQARLDTFAQTRLWDDAASCALRSTSKIEHYRIEGRYMLDVMDETWDTGTQILNAVLTGQRPMMTLGEVLAELPALAWPEEEAA